MVLVSQVLGAVAGAAFAAVMGFLVHGVLVRSVRFRLEPEDEHRGADIVIHNVTAYPEEELVQWRRAAPVPPPERAGRRPTGHPSVRIQLARNRLARNRLT